MSLLTRRALLQAMPLAALGAAGGARAGAVDAAAPPPGLSADFDPVSALWLSHAPGHEALTEGLVAALQPHVRLAFLVPDEESAARTLALRQGLEVVVESQTSFFLRDAAVFTREADGSAGIVDFRASQYGAAAWCVKRHAPGEERSACVAHAKAAAAERDALDRTIAQRLGVALHRTPLAMEGGGVEVNGRGLMIANAALYRTRNPKRSLAEVERELLRLPGLRKVIWLPEGLAEDVHLRATITGPYVAWGAGGHTDQFVRFADERTVLLAWPDEAEARAHPVARLTRLAMRRNLALLTGATDQRGRPLRVIKVPMPRIVQRRVVLEDEAELERSEAWRSDYFAPAEGRVEGQSLWQVATASYLNFVVANGAVVLPDYLPHGTPPEHQERVQRVFESAFPGRRIAFVDPISANWVGGGLHCATLNQP
jgi:agmatine deiminase